MPFLLKGWCGKDGLVIFQAGDPHLFREDAGVWPQMDCPGHLWASTHFHTLTLEPCPGCARSAMLRETLLKPTGVFPESCKTLKLREAPAEISSPRPEQAVIP